MEGREKVGVCLAAVKRERERVAGDRGVLGPYVRIWAGGICRRHVTLIH